MFYGRSNTGKTTLFSSFKAEGKKSLLLNVNDNGDDSIADAPHVKVMDIRTWEDLETTYWWLHRNPTRYFAVGLDTVSQMQQLAVNVIGGKGQHSKMKGKKLGEFGSMTKQQWGQVASMMKDWLTRFRDLPMEVVFIAQDRSRGIDDEADEGEVITPSVGPALSPSVASHLNASVHVIGNTFIRQRVVKKKVVEGKTTKTIQKKVTEYCLRLAPDPVYMTKIRKPRSITPPGVLVDPTYQKLSAIINGEDIK